MFTEIEAAIHLVDNGSTEEGLMKLRNYLKRATHEEKYIIAENFTNWGLVEEAKEIVDELILLYPDEGQLYILAAEISIDLENEEEALDLLTDIKEEDPSYTQALVLMADLYQLQGLDEVAEQKLLQAKRKEPNEILIDFGLAEFYMSKGDYKKAIPPYRLVAQKQEIIGDRNVNLSLAEALSVTGNFEEALEFYQKGLEEKVELHALNGYAFTAYQLERYELAIAKWNELKEIDAEYPSLYLHLAKAYEQEEQIKHAFDIAVEGSHIDPYNKELMFYSGKLALKLGDTQTAVTRLRESISLDPGYIEAVLTLTNIFLHEGMYEDTIECLHHSMEYGEYDPQFEWDLAKANKELENYSEALNHYEIAYNSFKDNIDFLEEYGYFLLEEGQKEKAISMLKKLVSLDPTQAGIEEELNRLEEW